MRNILLIAFHFPPFAQSSGVQRTLRYAQYLPDYGWEPIVLTVDARAHDFRGNQSVAMQAPPCQVVRVPALNAAKHLSIRGRYPGRFAIPDRWATWKWLARPIAVRLCQKHDIKAIWSTYPIATAHQIGHSVATSTGLPWIADFRDPMVQDDYPHDHRQREAFRTIEENTARQARTMVFTTPSAARTYQSRYPNSNCTVIENGYDESSFDGLALPTKPISDNRKLVLLHSGVVYPSERNPVPLFQTLASLKQRGIAASGRFVIRFRAPGFGDMLRKLALEYQTEDLIEICDPIPYRQALEEMLAVDGLLVLQANNCNEQIPAKLYEYIRTGQPILGLADPDGDTGDKLIQLGYPNVAPLESATAIESALCDFLTAIRNQSAYRPDASTVAQYSRKRQTRDLAELLDSMTAIEQAQR